MRISSQKQLELDYSGSGSPSTARQDVSLVGTPSVAVSGTIDFPEFGTSDRAYAETSRLAGRLNAASIKDEEHRALLKERQLLLDKKFAGNITKREINRLEYVRWSLDRIEDARQGYVLDMLEGAVARYESFLSDVQRFGMQLEQAKRQRR